MKSRLLKRLGKNTTKNNLQKVTLEKIVFYAKKNIKSGKDVNGKTFAKRKDKTKSHKILYKTGTLYKSIKLTRNKFSMLNYGYFNNYGTKRGITKRQFLPLTNTKQFAKILKEIRKGL